MNEHKTFFKEPLAGKRTGKTRRAARLKVEHDAKGAVRKEDRYCRFPSCGCRRLRLALAVAHLEHKGMGGNPAGDRNEVTKLILLCSGRHRELPVSLDMGAIRIRPLWEAHGTRGPCAFDISIAGLGKVFEVPEPDVAKVLGLLRGVEWVELARERGRHDFEPSTPSQARILAKLRGMTT